jgi:hypothetical protein
MPLPNALTPVVVIHFGLLGSVAPLVLSGLILVYLLRLTRLVADVGSTALVGRRHE